MFVQATRQKLRFSTTKGLVTVEDLWDMHLTSRNGMDLDAVAKGINKSLKENAEESFVVQKSTTNIKTLLMFEIVKYIISVKIAQREAREEAASNNETRKKLVEAIARKQEEQLGATSLEELTKQLKNLDTD